MCTRERGRDETQKERGRGGRGEEREGGRERGEERGREGGRRGRESCKYLLTPKTQAIATYSANPMSSRGMVAANWSNRPNKYSPLPRTNGKLIKKNMTHMIAAVMKEKKRSL